MKRFLPAVYVSWLFMGVNVAARDIEHSDLNNRIAIDPTVPTLLMFPDSVQASLTSRNLKLSSMSEGDTAKLWKATPHCKKDCDNMNAEFVTGSGKHLSLRLKTEAGVTDHLLSIKDEPLRGSLEVIRRRLPQMAREAFLQTVRGRPSFTKTEQAEPACMKKLADKWVGYSTDHLLVHVGTSSNATKKDIESLTDHSLVLVGAYDDSIVVVSRRTP